MRKLRYDCLLGDLQLACASVNGSGLGSVRHRRFTADACISRWQRAAKDRLRSMPALTLKAIASGYSWTTHRHPRLCSPSAGQAANHRADRQCTMDASGRCRRHEKPASPGMRIEKRLTCFTRFAHDLRNAPAGAGNDLRGIIPVPRRGTAIATPTARYATSPRWIRDHTGRSH